jgi:hypothetical protein
MAPSPPILITQGPFNLSRAGPRSGSIPGQPTGQRREQMAANACDQRVIRSLNAAGIGPASTLPSAVLTIHTRVSVFLKITSPSRVPT